MSWSMRCIGTPQKIKERIEKESSTLQGESKEEFDAAMPSLIALVDLNKGQRHPMSILLDASGHAWTDSGGQKVSNCSVKIEQIGAEVLAELV